MLPSPLRLTEFTPEERFRELARLLAATRSNIPRNGHYCCVPNGTTPVVPGWGLVQSLVHLKVAPLAIALFSKYTREDLNL